MKFAHLGDCHLGSWRQPALQQLNLESFKKAIEICIKENVDFILISGDLFDSAYPPIEILKETFSELRKLKEAGINCFIIAGSHDYSASGKTFLDVLEKAGFCRNVHETEERGNEIILNPFICKNCAIYGYPGKKSGMEISELKNIKLQEAPGFFRIFMLHTTLTKAKGSLPIESVDEESLPEVEYYALGHLHINYEEGNFIYSGPIFPNNFQELEELKYGSFYIINTSGSRRRIEIKLKDVEVVDLEIKNALTATEKIIFELDKREIKDKIVLLKLSGKLEQGKTSNINFQEIENFCTKKGAYVLLKSISQIETEEPEINIDIGDMQNLESVIIEKYCEENPSSFNDLILPLVNALNMEKQEDEKSAIFSERLFSELKKIVNIEI